MIINQTFQTEKYSIIDKTRLQYGYPVRATPGEIVYSSPMGAGISDNVYLIKDGSSIDDVYSDGRYKFIMPEGDVLIARDYPW